LRNRAGRFRISNLGLLEIQAAFAIKVRSGAIQRQAASGQRTLLMSDVASGGIEVYRLVDRHFATAEKLVERYSFAHRLRTLDALQLAIAGDLWGQTVLDRFVVDDQALFDLAVTEGIPALNPVVL
jgi:hypothetical protein